MLAPRSLPRCAQLALAVCLLLSPVPAQQSEARQWNELLLESFRNDLARPTVHARNLYHVSIAMWDAWATYDPVAQPVLFGEDHATDDPQVNLLRSEALSFASYRILRARFASSPGWAVLQSEYDQLMDLLGYDKSNSTTAGDSPAAIGNRIAQTVLAFGASDNANEVGGYANQHYLPVNQPLIPDLPGNPSLTDPDRWQPLSLDFFIDQAGNPIAFGYPEFLSPEWGQVSSFALSLHDLHIHERDGFDYWVFHDPGPPPLLEDGVGGLYKEGFEMVSIWSSHLDPTDGVMIDVSPNSIGNTPLPTTEEEELAFYRYREGGDWGEGYDSNPVTGAPYAVQMVPRGDYARVLAEFWADGPDSETPPGHWFVILNTVSDHPSLVKRIGGAGPIVDDLEWDVKAYLALGGAMHDCAVAAWGAKGWYDYIRPVSAIRFIADLGQCSDPGLPSYNPGGIQLKPGYIELVTAQTTAAGGKHEHLAGSEGKIALYSWRGPRFIVNPATDEAGVGWILAENWWPYQRPTFVTPPFAGYVSGHSTYSRAGAVILDYLTGSPYFPDGLGEFTCEQDEFLVFEDGPSVDVVLQWASYYDASDQCSLSRIWGGIHPPADDLPGREIGQLIGPRAFLLAEEHWRGGACEAAGSFQAYGHGCPGLDGFVPRLSIDGCPEPGGAVELRVRDAAPQAPAFLFISPTAVSLPAAGGCVLLVDPGSGLRMPITLGGSPGQGGTGSFTNTVQLSPTMPPGTSWNVQAVVGDPSNPWGYALSNGLSVQIL